MDSRFSFNGLWYGMRRITSISHGKAKVQIRHNLAICSDRPILTKYCNISDAIFAPVSKGIQFSINHIQNCITISVLLLVSFETDLHNFRTFSGIPEWNSYAT